MSIDPEFSTKTRQEQIAHAWQRLDSLLPADYLTTTVDGGVVADFRTADVGWRYSKVGFFRRLTGEKVSVSNRRREVGLPTNDALRWARLGIDTPYHGAIHDSLYKPIRPSEGSDLPLRHTRFGFTTTTGIDQAGHFRKDGLHFNLLQRLDQEEPEAAVLVVSYHDAHNVDTSHQKTKEFLTMCGFTVLNCIGSREEEPTLLEFCTDLALLHGQ